MADHSLYASPLSGRYPSKRMRINWSDDNKFHSWRLLWFHLARLTREFLPDRISAEAVEQLERAVRQPVDYIRAAELEGKLRHDVMAHAKTLGEAAPAAAGIIHLGCTSMEIDDNAVLLMVREALHVLIEELVVVLNLFAQAAQRYAGLPVVGWTHFKAAAVTTFGKRLCLYLQDLLWDFQRLEQELETLPFRGLKGAVGTQQSFLQLLNGDVDKVRKLESMLAAAFGFNRTLIITSQTYPRKLDMRVVEALVGIGVSSHKFETDMRLLGNLREVDEPFAAEQVSSSAMPHKRNFMRSERGCSLSRELHGMWLSAAETASLQWLERTLDDSAGRRRWLSEAFLTADALCQILQNVMNGLVVYPAWMQRHLQEELPFLAIDALLLPEMVKAGADRQMAHGWFREHALAASKRIQEEAADNDLLERLAGDEKFAAIRPWLAPGAIKAEDFAILAPQQVEWFLAEEVRPALLPYQGIISATKAAELRV